MRFGRLGEELRKEKIEVLAEDISNYEKVAEIEEDIAKALGGLR